MESEEIPPLSELDYQADRVASLLMNRNGGMDWQSLPLICEWLGITDIDGLMIRLATFVTYRPKRQPNGNSNTIN